MNAAEPHRIVNSTVYSIKVIKLLLNCIHMPHIFKVFTLMYLKEV